MSQQCDRSLPHWVIYALGGGWGHLNRALALARVAAERYRVTILTNSPNVGFVDLTPQPPSLPGKGELGRICIEAIAPDLSREAICDRVREFLLNTAYDCLIVDTFPRGLGGELAEILPQLSVPRILVHRDLNPDYVQAKDLSVFVAQHFEQILIPGEGDNLSFSYLPNVYHTDPWLIRNADELPSLETARSLLRLPANSVSTILVCASSPLPPSLRGKGARGLGQLDQEVSLFGKLTAQLQAALPEAAIRCLSPQCPLYCPPELWVTHWPGIDCLQVADVVVGGAGYNTTYECAALQIPLVSFAFPRLYDRQLRRAERSNYLVQSIPEAIATVKTLLQQSPQRRCNQPVNYVNGAVEAVKEIEKAIAGSQPTFTPTGDRSQP